MDATTAQSRLTVPDAVTILDDALRFATRNALAAALAARTAELLRLGITQRGQAAIGASSITACPAWPTALARLELNWEAVAAWPTDAPGPVGHASPSAEMPANREARPASRATRGISTATLVPSPFDAVILEARADGGAGSIAPAAEYLAEGLDETAAPRYIATAEAPAPGSQHLMLNLAALLDSRWIAVVATGKHAWTGLEKATAGSDAYAMPIRAIVNQNRVPAHVYWAP